MKRRRKENLEPGYVSSARAMRKIHRINDRSSWHLDAYHHLLTMPWSLLFVVMMMAYVLLNFVFACLYLIQDGSITNARPGSLADAFFFSIQTIPVIGYGEMRPATLYANILVTIEILLGLTMITVATGLVFARFSRPTARVMFSKVAVITLHDGIPTLMFRAANQRRNQILDAQVTMALLRDEISREGASMRRFHDLHVARSRSPMFALSWTVMHPINEASPLYGLDRETLKEQKAEIVVGLMGFDETAAQTVFARHAYLADEILWDRRFVDILARRENGRRVVDYRLFHETEEAPHVVPHRVRA